MKSELIARQSRLPQGWLGEIVARVMSLETTAANQRAIERLAPAPGEAVLEVGCGHGRTLAKIASSGVRLAAGVDPSDVMVRLARRRLRHEIRGGRAVVEHADAASMSFKRGCFDAALAVHVVYFWKDPRVELREIHRVVRTGGRVLLGFRPRDATSVSDLPATVYALRTLEDVAEMLIDAGFCDLKTDLEPVGKFSIGWVCAHK